MDWTEWTILIGQAKRLGSADRRRCSSPELETPISALDKTRRVVFTIGNRLATCHGSSRGER